MEEQQTTNNWIDEEIKELEEQRQQSELPSLHFEEGKIYVFEVDFSKPFEKWVDEKDGYVKKLLPVMHEGEMKIFWLNTRNPLYREILAAYKEKGQTLFKVIRTGTAKDTRYNMVKD